MNKLFTSAKQGVIAVLVASAVLLGVTSTAAAQPGFLHRQTVIAKLPAKAACIDVCFTPGEGNSVPGTVILIDRFQDIDTFCLTLYFGADKLNPGEGFDIVGFGGAQNVGTTTQASREVCLAADDPALQGLKDSHERINVYATSGSFVVSNITVVASGTRR